MSESQLDRVNNLRNSVWDLIPPSIRRILKKRTARYHKSARILARQIARSEHHIRARPLLHRGKAWRG